MRLARTPLLTLRRYQEIRGARESELGQKGGVTLLQGTGAMVFLGARLS